MGSHVDRLITALVVTLLAAVPASAAAITAPYTIDFSTFPPGDTVIPNLVERPSSNLWTITPTGRYSVATPLNLDVFVPPQNRAAALEVTNLAGRDFQMSTRFTLSRFSARPATQHGLVCLLAFSSKPQLDLSSFYTVGLQLAPSASGPAGALVLIENAAWSDDIEVSSSVLPIAAGTTYDMVLRGHFEAGQLQLVGSATDGQSTVSVSDSYANPLTGRYFGLGTMQGDGNSFTTDFHYLSIPEPSTAALLLVQLFFMHRPRRRKAPYTTDWDKV